MSSAIVKLLASITTQAKYQAGSDAEVTIALPDLLHRHALEWYQHEHKDAPAEYHANGVRFDGCYIVKSYVNELCVTCTRYNVVTMLSVEVDPTDLLLAEIGIPTQR